jgi:hypothetical protein
MAASPDEAPSAAGARPNRIAEWRQGDYTTKLTDFVWIDGFDGDGPVVESTTVQGCVVVTQTCDIVNDTPGKEHVVVSPLVEVDERELDSIVKGRTPVYAHLDTPPSELTVADLGRFMTVSKSALEALDRNPGLSDDEGRARFAAALERKHGRFAFPDAFSVEVLGKLRKRVVTSHDKQQAGKPYRSIETVRVSARPNWDAADVEVLFHFVLAPEKDRESSLEEIRADLDRRGVPSHPHAA